MSVRTKYINVILAIYLLFGLNSCIVVDTTPGPPGYDGRAYFGVDYDNEPPYSYWDNNSSIPYNPVLGQYYNTAPGVYRFEYFINQYEYWYGTYEIWINRGGPGQSYGKPGIDGMDTYLMLICNPNGYYDDYFESYKKSDDEERLIEFQDEKHHYRIKIQKSDARKRIAQSPKYKP